MKKYLEKFKTKKWRIFLKIMMVIVIIGVLILAMLKFILYPVHMMSSSMSPTIKAEDYVGVTKVYNPSNIQRGDIVSFKIDDCHGLIKRVIGIEGDKISINNGVVIVNGEKLQEDYILDCGDNNGEYEVPEGKFFMLGDNRPNSWDSTKWINPYIDGEDIEGKVQFIAFPFIDFGSVYN